MTEVPGDWLSVPAGVEYVSPLQDTLGRRARLFYNDSATVAEGECDFVSTAANDPLFRVDEQTIPDGFTNRTRGAGWYALAQGVRDRPLGMSPEALGLTQPEGAVGFEWEDESGGICTAYEIREQVDPPGPWQTQTGQRSGEAVPVPAATGYLRAGLFDAATVTRTPNPIPGRPNLETATAPRPDTLAWEDVDTITVPATDVSAEVLAPLPVVRVPFADGQWVGLHVTSSWAITQEHTGSPRIQVSVIAGAATVYPVYSGPWPRYRWLYPAPTALRYGWGVLLG